MSTYPDPYRWISLHEAVQRLPMRRADARVLLITSGLVHEVASRQAVWLPDLEQLKADPTQAANRSPKPAPASASGTPLVPMPRRAAS